MFNLGMGEITIILILALIFLGPKKLPELASGLGKLIREIRKTTSDVKNEIQLDDVIRKPMEELREAITLHPEELKRRDRMKRELEELARRAEELQRAQPEDQPVDGQEQGQPDARDVAEQATAAGEAPATGASPDETTVDATGAGAATAESPEAAAAGPTIPTAAPTGTVSREPSAGHAPPAPPLAAVLARGPGAPPPDKRTNAAGTDFLRSLRAVPDARRPSPSRPNPTAEPAGAADRTNTTQTLTEADLAAITVGGPPPPPAPTGHTGKTQPPPPPARLPGATPPKSSSNS